MTDINEQPRSVETTQFSWQGRRLRISYEPRWLNLDFISHLQVWTLDPAKAPLPITETGYRSQFMNTGALAGIDDVAAYVIAWLDDAAKAPEWQKADAARSEPSLFDML